MSTTEALGIAIGDLLTTSYGRSSPYRVESIWGPHWWWTNFEASWDHVTIWPYPVISITGTLLSDPRNGVGYFNFIHQNGARWFNDQGDEIIIEKVAATKVYRQANLFLVDDDPRRRPYPFDPSVDYSDQNRVFQCWQCRRDFNGQKWNGGHANPHCPYCQAWVAKTVIVMERVIPGRRYWSQVQRCLGFSGHPVQVEKAEV